MFFTPCTRHDNSRFHPMFSYYAVTVILIGYSFIIIPTIGNPQDFGHTQDHTGRHRRDGSSSTRESRTFYAATPIPEDVGNDVNLFDLTTTNIRGTFTVTPNNTAGVPRMFEQHDGRFVRLNPDLTQIERKQFDFEAHPVIDVNVTVVSTQGENEEVTLTIRLPLSDVNDEPPTIVAEVTPLLAQVGSEAMPWTVVYQLTATDQDSRADLVMTLVEVEPTEYWSRFKLQMDSRTGSKVVSSIVVAGSEPLPESQEITITMVVEDRNASGPPQVIVEKVQVLVGVRAPQFYSSHYTGFLSESLTMDDRNRVTTADNTPLVVKVVNFDPGVPVEMRMLEWDVSESARFRITEDGVIWNLQVMDFERVQSAMLLVEASNSGSDRTSTAQVHISIRDENDHSPEFSQDNYIVTVPEDMAVGGSIALVIAGDKDSGMNQDLEFFLSDNDDFYVDTIKNERVYHGHVKVKRLLDYDGLSVPVLTFPVMVRDQGVPARTATANVIVTLKNVNDNKPNITVHGSNKGTIEMVETLSSGSVVTVVQAWDRDWDGVLLSFSDGTLNQDIFTIDPHTGVIKTISTVDTSRDKYLLTIRAVDDGNCCVGTTTLTSSYTLNVIVTDINSNKPEFEFCSEYDMKLSVLEKSPSRTHVITVKATDKDRGENGRVIYSIDGANSPFSIDPDTGNISVKETINRDSSGYQQVTVIGRNPGDVPLMMGWCSFRIRIDDVNDHSPAFSSQRYDAEVLQDARPGESIATMLATDGDIGENARITYELSPLTSVDDPIFTIDEHSGIVSLRSQVSEEVGLVYTRVVKATDNGTHPHAMSGTTMLNIEVVAQKTTTSSWINPPATREFFVSETAQSGHVITNLTCRSGHISDPRVIFIVYNAENSITTASRQFEVVTPPSPGGAPDDDDDNNSITGHLVTLGRDLDYETRQDYVIHVVCQDYDTTSKELTMTIHLVDANDERPLFVGLVGLNDGYYVGSAPENRPPGTFVTYVQAVDRDTQPEFKNITFSIEGEESDWFSVERVSSNQAKILTRQSLDREEKETYNLRVIARDGAPSALVRNTATRQIQVTVTDVNDNSPSFGQAVYTHSVSESASLNQLVFSVTATDVDLVDSKLDYVFESGNTNGVFSVIPGSGEIRVARKLDYDVMTDKVYRLTLQATDQGAKHTATTRVEVTILDENDNPPTFTLLFYEVRDRVVEHDDSVKIDNPMNLTRITATDKDRRQQTDIRYSLLNASDAMRRLFYVDESTGDVFLTGDLDRDRLDTFYMIGVVARDETESPLLGYAQVKVYPIDINERPKFAREDIQASLKDNSQKDTLVTTITAIDSDEGPNGTISYTLDNDQPNPGMFRIETSTGNLRIDTVLFDEELDTERMSHLFVSVVVYDLGSPRLTATATVTVTIRDENDQGPKFVRRSYNLTILENAAGRVLASRPIQAIDRDTDPANKQLVFNIIPGDARFFVRPSANNQAVAFIGITSTNPPDYENDPHNLTFALRVSDGVQGHEDSIPITVFIQDYNDNPPVFSGTSENVTLLDGTPRFTNVTQFDASDADEGTNAEIEFSILRASDPRHEFSIQPDTGIVTTRKVLDREKEAVITLIIIATDKGQTPLSSSATLVITLTDTNDCPPQFIKPYRPVVNENTPPDNNNNNNNDRLVVEIFATDPDTLAYGSPFGFQLPSACDTPACHSFRLEFNPDGDGGNGTALITTSLTFDREVRKEYRLPIVMWDMRDRSGPLDQPSQTATNTLTITIGDHNDNPHSSGHQDVHVYNYRGTKGPKEIGRVHAEDLDDWDLADKTFTANLSPIMQVYFRVANDTGMITMFENVPPSKLQPSPTYDFEVDVYDQRWDKTVTCSVSVTVEELSDEAVRTAGSVRMAGVSAEEFIQKRDGTQQSKYDKFRDMLSSILGYSDASHVDVVSIQESDSGLLDIRVGAHGSPYLNPSQVDSAIMLHREEFESSLGVTVVMVPINLCMEEVYDVGCTTVMEVTQQANLVNSNGTSFVGVQVRTSAVPDCLDCNFPTPGKCNGGYCYNGGTCHQDDWGKMTCQCIPGFDGPRCQQRRHHFNGSSVAFYPSLSVCVTCRTMFDFITLQENGLVMHSGDIKDQGDYFLFELQSGYPRLRISLGAGELLLTLDGKDQSGSLMMPKLNDGKWHHIDIDKNDLHVHLTVDKCQPPIVTSSHDIIKDWTWCRSSGTVPGTDILLNTPGFLHVGGPHPPSTDARSGLLPSQGFSGCLKDFIHNTKLYDLSYKEIRSWNSGTPNCPTEEQICASDATCGERADCVTEWLPLERVVSCSCQPGWKGDKCDEETPIKDFGAKSFLYWSLGHQPTVGYTGSHQLSLMFRTRQQTGTLFSITSDWLDSIVIQLSHGKLGVIYSQGLDGPSASISLQDASVANGQWHDLVLERHVSEFSLSLDHGEGRNYRYVIGQDDHVVLFEAMPFVSSGAPINHVIQDRVDSEYNADGDLVDTCISDVRYNGVWLPMEETDPSTRDGRGAALLRYANVKDGCSRQDCVSNQCVSGTTCLPLWEDHECRSIIPMCGAYFCFNGGLCVTVNGVTSCQCVFPWIGVSCNVSASALVGDDADDGDVLAAGAIAGMVIGILTLLVLLVLLVLLIALRRQNKDKSNMADILNDDLIRESVIYYDEEGAGEKDNDGFSLSHLGLEAPPRIQYKGNCVVTANHAVQGRDMARGDALRYGIRHILDTNMDKMDDDGRDKEDETHQYSLEGSGSIATSLSSLSLAGGSESSQEYDYLGEWGPKFSRLADIYEMDSS